jgi:PAT family beta-lactamase induction signal transducer AmpG
MSAKKPKWQQERIRKFFAPAGKACYQGWMSDGKPTAHRLWAWIPTLYLTEGLPYALTTFVAVVLYKNLGLTNADITLYTGWLYLPWVLKPLWSPVVDLLRTRRQWIWAMQILMGGALAGVALTIPTAHFFQLTLAFFWLLAFSSATHDIAADGFYLLAATEQEQSFFSGIRNTCYRVATICAQGGLVMLAGTIQERTGNYPLAWSVSFGVMAGLLLGLGLYHFVILPKPLRDQTAERNQPEALPSPGRPAPPPFWEQFVLTFRTFFQKPGIVTMLLFLLLYRLGEAQLVRMVPLFLLDPRSRGGLGLNDQEVSLAYGTVGVASLMAGGLLGGWVVSRQGLKFWLWPMLLAIHLPDGVFIWLAQAQPASLPLISAGVGVEQFGYGFGFTAFMMYMIYMARGEHPTAHYALCTGFMALGMMVPGQWSGWLEQHLGYPHFFLWVILATLPSFLVALRLPLEADFGRRQG